MASHPLRFSSWKHRGLPESIHTANESCELISRRSSFGFCVSPAALLLQTPSCLTWLLYQSSHPVSIFTLIHAFYSILRVTAIVPFNRKTFHCLTLNISVALLRITVCEFAWSGLCLSLQPPLSHSPPLTVSQLGALPLSFSNKVSFSTFPIQDLCHFSLSAWTILWMAKSVSSFKFQFKDHFSRELFQWPLLWTE